MERLTVLLFMVCTFALLALVVFLLTRCIDLVRYLLAQRQVVKERDYFNQLYPISGGGGGE